jgi:predicted amidophosphoribosyltransferase
MVFCPSCHSDYPAEILICPDCNEELIEKLKSSRPVAEAPDDSWVVVGKLSGNKILEQAKQIMETNNIPSILIPTTFAKPFNAPLDDDKLFELSGFDDEKLMMVPRDFQIEAKLIMRTVLRNEML